MHVYYVFYFGIILSMSVTTYGLHHELCRDIDGKFFGDYITIPIYDYATIPCNGHTVIRFPKYDHHTRTLISNYNVLSRYGDRISFDNSTVTVSKYDPRTDDGMYLCISDTISCVIVMDHDYFLDHLYPITVKRGSLLHLRCQPHHDKKYRSDSTGTWMYVDSDFNIHSIRNVMNDTSLRIENIQPTDAGSYVCENRFREFYIYHVTVTNRIIT